MAGVRFMVWGAGFFGRKWIETIRGRPECAITAVVARNSETVRQVCGDFGLGAIGFPSVEAALAGAKADAVVIALPQQVHPEAISAALAAGLHVLTEKPLALDMDQARAIWAAARQHPDRVVMVNQNFRWRPAVQALRGAVREGRAGNIGQVVYHHQQDNRRQTTRGWREAMAEPFLQDMVIHHFDLMRYLTGREAVAIQARSFRPPWSWFPGNSAASALVEMDGLRVHYFGSFAGRGFETPQEGIITITGDAGALRMDERGDVTLLRDGKAEAVTKPALDRTDLAAGLDQFLKGVVERVIPETTLEDNLRSFAMVCAAVESARQGRTVAVPPLLDFLGRRAGGPVD